MRTRQKVILSVLLNCPVTPTRTQLIKWLFLLRQETPLAADPAFYDFLPYHYGPYSFEAANDLTAFARNGVLDGAALRIAPQRLGQVQALEATLPPAAREAVMTITRRYGTCPTRRLVQVVYDRYPWYASRSRLRPPMSSPAPAPLAVYTIGYQDRTVDGFLNALVRSGIGALIDVRHNPLSRKYGFSGGALRRSTANLGMQYLHCPQLGIESALRKGVDTPAAHQALLDHYERQILPQRRQAAAQVARLLAAKPSALMCFEADVRCCHRGRLANWLAGLARLPVVHL